MLANPPRPGDGPEYHAKIAFWKESVRTLGATEEQIEAATATPVALTLERERLRQLATAARDAFPGWDWPTARHCSKASFAYVVSDNDAPHSDPTGAFCDAISPDVVLDLLDALEAKQDA